MASYLYDTAVMHARLRPVRHEFSYKQHYWGFDLDELSELSQSVKQFGYNRFRPYSIHDKDYLSWGAGTIKEKLVTLLQERGVDADFSRVHLITCPRYFGYVFNPVSFYFCYGPDLRLRSLLYEVNNTFNEKHVYYFPVDGSGALKAHIDRHKKTFHVSPFFEMDYDYVMRFKDEPGLVDIAIDLKKAVTDEKGVSLDETFFVSRLWGRGCNLSSKTIVQFLLRHPIEPVLTMPRIIWQALRLVFQRRLPVQTKPNPLSNDTIRAEPYSWTDQVCRYLVRKTLQKLERGTFEVAHPDGRRESFGKGLPIASVQLHNNNIFRRLITGGGIGLGESYVDGDWDSVDLSGMLKHFLNNFHVFDESKVNLVKPLRWLARAGHMLKSNSLSGSKKNISAHYDLSNEMFSLFLDPSMMYSSAKFESSTQSLEDAQLNKVRTILDKAGVRAGMSVLEIGSGWGTLAIEAAKRGCTVRSLTLSEEQRKLAMERAEAAGVGDKINFDLCDYRQAEGQYDSVISIEMLEAVGHENLGNFFKSCEKLLKPDGTLVLQFIAFPDYDYERYMTRQDWIQKHIFPGSHLPSLQALVAAATKRSRLTIESIDNIAPHYAETLKRWRVDFNKSADKVRALGFDDRFIRTWNFYLASCEAEFATRWLGLYQVVFSRHNNQRFLSEDSKFFGSSGAVLNAVTETTGKSSQSV